MFAPLPESGTLRVVCRRSDYVASQLARAVEDCDATLYNLNILAEPSSVDDTETITLEIRVDSANTDSVTRSLQRYGYRVVAATATSAPDDDTFRSRINELLHYLEL